MTNAWRMALCLTCVAHGIFAQDLPVDYAMTSFDIVPDIIPFSPLDTMLVKFQSAAVANLGNEIPEKYTRGVPEVDWEGFSEYYYTLAMIDAGESRPTKPFRQWLVTNIKGNDIALGDNVSPFMESYMDSDKPEYHRHVILVYKQPEEFQGKILRRFKRFLGKRLGFSVADFLFHFNMTVPQFGDFYITNKYPVTHRPQRVYENKYRKNLTGPDSQEPSYEASNSFEQESEQLYYLDSESQERNSKELKSRKRRPAI